MLKGGFVRGFGEDVGAGADVGEVDAYEGQAVGGVFFGQGGCKPTVGAGERVDGFGTLNTGCDL